MIGYLSGKILSLNQNTGPCVVLAYRLGYEVILPKRLLATLIEGQRIELWIHTHVREDAFTLYGFSNQAEKQLFRLLLTVSGLGPKTALSLISEHGAQSLVEFVVTKDIEAISSAPGVGKRLAQKLVIELNPKIEKISLPPVEPSATKSQTGPYPRPKERLREDLHSALLNLGFHPSQVKQTLEKLFDPIGPEPASFETCLKDALKELARRSVSKTALETPYYA